MTTAEFDSSIQPQASGAEPITGHLDDLDAMVGAVASRPFDDAQAERLGERLRRLHARFRIHRAAQLHEDSAIKSWPPELVNVQERLRSEHPILLGQLDRLIRSVESMPDRAPDDKEVFILRVRELIAALRRHLAEEDRLVYLALWHDTGGEAG